MKKEKLYNTVVIWLTSDGKIRKEEYFKKASEKYKTYKYGYNQFFNVCNSARISCNTALIGSDRKKQSIINEYKTGKKIFTCAAFVVFACNGEMLNCKYFYRKKNFLFWNFCEYDKQCIKNNLYFYFVAGASDYAEYHKKDFLNVL